MNRIKSVPEIKGEIMKPDYILDVEDRFESFDEFWNKCRPFVYKSIIKLFDGLKTNKKESLSLRVSSTISGLPFESIFNYSKKDKITLIRDIIPYFEQIEDYEFCEKILTLYNELI